MKAASKKTNKPKANDILCAHRQMVYHDLQRACVHDVPRLPSKQLSVLMNAADTLATRLCRISKDKTSRNSYGTHTRKGSFKDYATRDKSEGAEGIS